MLEPPAFSNLVGGLLIHKLREQFIGVWECCCRTFACYDVAIYGYEVARIVCPSLIESLFETWVAGSFLTVQYA